MVVTHVVNDRVKAFEFTEAGALSSIIANFETGGKFAIHWLKAINKKSNLCSGGKVRQKLFTVIADSRTLRAERAEVSQFHKKVSVARSP
jgi:hypothetical protein